MALVSTRNVVAFLHMETTYGTPPTVVVGDAILLMNTQVVPAADKLERDVDRPYMGGDPFVLVGKRVTLTADCDLLGPASGFGTSPAPLGGLYRTCGHAEVLVPATSVAYNPISVNFESSTVDFYWAGAKFRMTGVRGYMDFSFNIKTYAKGSVTLTGLLTQPADGTAPSPVVWTAFQTPPAIESGVWTVSVGGTAVCAQSIEIQQNATVSLIECSNSRQVVCTDRKPGGTLKVYKDQTLTVWNPWAVADAQAVVTIVNTITKGAGLNMTMPLKAQLEYPKPSDFDGVAGYEIPFSLVPASGGDEYVMTFT